MKKTIHLGRRGTVLSESQGVLELVPQSPTVKLTTMGFQGKLLERVPGS